MASGCLTDELENDNNVCDYDYAYDEYEDCTQTASNRCESVVEALSPRFKPKIANKLNNGINFNELSQISLDKHNSDKENCAMQIGLPPHMPIDDEQTDQTTNDSYNASNSRESPGRSTGLRSNDKRGRPTNARKEKRRMREKRRSTGVVHLHMSTESTGEEEDGAKIVTVETKQNTQTNEVISSGNVETCEVRCALSQNLRQMITGSCAKVLIAFIIGLLTSMSS
ncbi:PREDICTED: uncharacterized protein LOC106813172 [Priapulus caudatus]|uniref:Uncharacterized protein LOC106813172 n=1 Tax=Priapulus caudatus TaxID=37621 RepID=A0ABM1EKK9_PRICU|nr:PREDICTED: uncharacterized protein LOC106813172 [Priapulus caudatus]